jgi:Zn-finger nucleic acid-binding protein
VKCPIDGSELERTTAHDVPAALCGTCHGLWIERDDFAKLEDEAFDLGDQEKGTMVFESEATDHPCPECGVALRSFQYRMYDLELELCPVGHGYWLTAGEDDRVLELMLLEENDLKRSEKAEGRWKRLLGRLRSGSFLERVRGVLR